MSYQLLSFVYSQLPSVRVNSSLNIEFRYLKGDKRDTVRKPIAISALTGIFFYLMVLVLPREYRNDDLTFYRDITLSLLYLILMYFLYQINKKYYPEPLFRLIRKFFDKRLKDDELWVEGSLVSKSKVNINQETNSSLPLITKNIDNKELNNILKNYSYFKFNNTSKILLLHLLENGRLKDNDIDKSDKGELKKSDDLKIVFVVNAPSENNIKREILLDFFKDIFHFEFFEESHNEAENNAYPHYTKADFHRFIVENFVIKMSDGEERSFAYNDLFRKK